jgi:hypothetical protein
MNTLPLELVETILLACNCIGECSGVLRIVCIKWKSIIDRIRPPYTLITWVENVSCAEWALQNKCSWRILNCDYAAKYNYLELLKWVRSKNSHWDAVTCTIAARHGNLEILQYLRANRCPWDKYTCYWTSHARYPHVSEWIGMPCSFVGEYNSFF